MLIFKNLCQMYEMAFTTPLRASVDKYKPYNIEMIEFLLQRYYFSR